MSIIIIESIGFSATHSISDFLRLIPNIKVSHGTKNFTKNTSIGVDNLLFDEFYNQMLSQSQKYDYCISVHSNYLPNDISKVIDEKTTKFFGLMRKSQFNQIMSCFYWAVNGFLNGREDLSRIFSEFQSTNGNSLKQIGLPVNMKTCLMLYAFNHVLKFNLELYSHTSKILFMEDIIANPRKFLNLIGISSSFEKSIKIEQGPSHKNEVKQFEFLSNADDILEKISSNFYFNYGNEKKFIHDIDKLCASKSLMN